ncbi:hypothetical protein GWC77_26470 [Paraburkholderia sp. NMBU_R16]|uniref:hypothetical protein n=1 Tax=Paraburkholderia sp. NMBU_R16 TaxID=2698676 RepID=UPI0015649D75|nr:hypothetical protein [Paraburkholderia sp. NMBU_R16]NRO99429.1 hypothetical protein [Paraburkholderia sp. NMBU_R16]
MNTPANESSDDGGLPSVLALFERERLPFPPVPERLAVSLRRKARGWFSTRPTQSSPYCLEEFLAEVETHPHLPDYAVVGFDGYGTNSWAMHYYLVGKAIALFIQLPWGGAFLETGPARAGIVELLEWAANLQSKLQEADALRRIPDGVRLEVVASRFGRAGWRWLDAGRNPMETPWNPPFGMKDAMLREIDNLIGGQLTLTARRSTDTAFLPRS